MRSRRADRAGALVWRLHRAAWAVVAGAWGAGIPPFDHMLAVELIVALPVTLVVTVVACRNVRRILTAAPAQRALHRWLGGALAVGLAVWPLFVSDTRAETLAVLIPSAPAILALGKATLNPGPASGD